MNDKPTILAVDDTSADLLLMVNALAPSGYRVLTADSGALALAAVAANPPDLILLDIRMPGMDGLEVCRRLKAREETRHIPIILISAYAEAKERVEGLQLGAADYINKPFLIEEFRTRVKTHLALSRANDALEQKEIVLRKTNEHLQSAIVENQAVEDELRQSLERTELSRRAMLSTLEDQKQARDSLLASETRYRRLFESAKDGIFIIDFETGTVVDVNPFMTESLGYSRDEILGKKVWELGFWGDFIGSEANFEELKQKEYIRYDDKPLKTADGRKLDVEFVSNIYEVNQRKVIQCNIRDITERKRAEERVRASEDRFNRYIERTPDGVFMVDGTGRYTMANGPACRITGFSRDELLRMSISDLVAEESLEDGLAHFRRMMETGAAAADLWHRRKDGSTCCLTVDAVKLSETQVLGFCKDITDHKRAEEALEASEEKHRALFESSHDAIMTLAPPSWRFTTGNPATIRMFEVQDEATFTTLEPWDLAPEFQPDGRPSNEKAIETIQTAMATGSHLFEWTHQRMGGESFPTTVLLTRMEIGGTALLQATVRDITERKLAEAEREKLEGQLRTSQKMEAIGSLAGGIAHDFNNLLSVILSYTGFALDAVPEGEPLREDLLEVKNAGERSAALVRQLLAFSRKQLLEPKPLDLNQITADFEKMLRRILGEDIDFVQKLSPDLGLTFADPGQIEQVLMNLVVNARDAMPGGGKLTIDTANVVLDDAYAASHTTVEPGPYVMLAVTDTGCGMDAGTKARIFEPFFTTKNKDKGTGLGLSTVYGIVKQSGGDIHVYSEPGIGTTFKIYLPRKTSMMIAESRAAIVPTRLTGDETILVVEDEEAVCNVAKRILGAAGYTVLIAASGADALAECERHEGEIHLVLTDVVMPEMGGRVFAERLAKVRKGIKVLYMSGYTDNAIVHHGTLDPGTKFIGKPFNATDLTRKVREVLDGEGAGAAQ